MHPVLASLDLVAMVAAAIAVVTGRSRHWGWLLLLAAGAWLPLNNAVLEGPVLVAVDEKHGLTVSDVFGIGGAVVGGLRLWPPQRGRSGAWFVARAALVGAVLVAGFVAALVVTDVRIEDASVR